MKRTSQILAAAALALSALAAHAGLVARPGGMVYDDVLNITWLADWNYAKTSGFDTDGAMGWATANNWAENLVFGGFDDWRLPTTKTTVSSNCAEHFNPGGGFPDQYYGYNCTGSEMGHMFYSDLGAIAGSSILSSANTANLALFTNVQSHDYWSSTEYAPDPEYTWHFGTLNGSQYRDFKYWGMYAVAVRSGDVAASVPEPQTLVLALLAVGAAVGARRKRSV
jgi:MYXO-CTERM domain-containing protein